MILSDAIQTLTLRLGLPTLKVDSKGRYRMNFDEIEVYVFEMSGFVYLDGQVTNLAANPKDRELVLTDCMQRLSVLPKAEDTVLYMDEGEQNLRAFRRIGFDQLIGNILEQELEALINNIELLGRSPQPKQPEFLMPGYVIQP